MTARSAYKLRLNGTASLQPPLPRHTTRVFLSKSRHRSINESYLRVKKPIDLNRLDRYLTAARGLCVCAGQDSIPFRISSSPLLTSSTRAPCLSISSRPRILRAALASRTNSYDRATSRSLSLSGVFSEAEACVALWRSPTRSLSFDFAFAGGKTADKSMSEALRMARSLRVSLSGNTGVASVGFGMPTNLIDSSTNDSKGRACAGLTGSFGDLTSLWRGQSCERLCASLRNLPSRPKEATARKVRLSSSQADSHTGFICPAGTIECSVVDSMCD